MKLKPVVLHSLLFLVTACGALDEGSDSNDNGPSANALSGLWIGTTEEQGVTEALDTLVVFIDEQVFILREDEAHLGNYLTSDNGRATMEADIYTYATPDTDNQFYVGNRSNSQFDMDALFATSESLFINYEGNSRSGSMTLELDVARDDNLTLARVAGQWDTTDSVMYINDEGGLQGSNSATGCQWKGHLKTFKNDLLTLSIERKLCPDFNQTIGNPVDGYALIDGEGILHFMAQQPNQFLWMQFESASGTTAPTDTPDETEETTEEAAAAE